MSYAKFVRTRGSATRKRYERALIQYNDVGLVHRDTIISAFVKAEKTKDTEDKYRPPRLIQFRPTIFVGELGRCAAPQEHAFYKLVDWSEHPMVAKGQNSYQRADVIAFFMEELCWCAIMADFKAYDAHQVKSIQVQEHKLMDWMAGGDADFRNILKMTRSNTGRTTNNIRYYHADGRMSGEFITGYGNSLNTCVFLHHMCERWCIPEGQFHIYCDGDDANIFINPHYLHQVDMDMVRDYGQEATFNIARDISEFEFCQCKPVYDGIRWRMIRNIDRFLERTRYSVNQYTGHGWRRLMYSIARCELSLNTGMPIIQEWCLNVLRQTGECEMLHNIKAYEHLYAFWHEPKAYAQPVTDIARTSFAAAFGYEPSEQLELERSLSKMYLDIDNTIWHLDHDETETTCSQHPRQLSSGKFTS